jgi:ABC-type dipeptide/oligopeptide/nickel transport system permease subunit
MTTSGNLASTEAEAAPAPLWRDAAARLAHSGEAWAGGLVVGLLVAAAVLAPLVAPHDPIAQFADGLDELGRPLGPSWRFPLGTDELGRDVLSRLLFGARLSLALAAAATGIALVVGCAVGVAAGFFGGWVDALLMRLTDVVLAFPALLLAMALVSVLRPSAWTVALVLGLVQWTYIARLVRGKAVFVMRLGFMEAARAAGVGRAGQMVRHLMPNALAPVFAWAALSLAATILAEAALSFIGVGVQPPTPVWGQMIERGQDYFREAPGLTIYPGVAIVLAVLGFNLLGDALKAALDPAAREG